MKFVGPALAVAARLAKENQIAILGSGWMIERLFKHLKGGARQRYGPRRSILGFRQHAYFTEAGPPFHGCRSSHDKGGETMLTVSIFE